MSSSDDPAGHESGRVVPPRSPLERWMPPEASGVACARSRVPGSLRCEVISDHAKQRAWSAVRTLNHQAAVINLTTKRTRNIGIIQYSGQSDVTNPFYSFVIRGVIREAMKRDYNLLFLYVESKYRGTQDLPKMIREANVAGVLFLGRVVARMLYDIQDSGAAVVAIDHTPRIKGISSVQIDNRGGGELAAKHLLDLGHERFAFVGWCRACASIAERGEGFLRVLDQHRAAPAFYRQLVSCDTLTFQEGYRRSVEFFGRSKGVTAIFCANDEVAAGVLRAAHGLGLSVPSDVSVVGFDDIIMGNYTEPPLTTIGTGKEWLGRQATISLLDLVEGRRADARTDVVPVELIVRSSSAVPPPKSGIPRSRACRGTF